jgi:hypothetical protein
MAQVHPKSLPASARANRAPSRLRAKRSGSAETQLSPAVRRCRAKFRRHFKQGFYDPLYVDWERDYKWQAYKRWEEALSRSAFADLLSAEKFAEIAAKAVAIESRTNLLFSFEKMALRDAVKSSREPGPFRKGCSPSCMGQRIWRPASHDGARWFTICPAGRRAFSRGLL